MARAKITRQETDEQPMSPSVFEGSAAYFENLMQNYSAEMIQRVTTCMQSLMNGEGQATSEADRLTVSMCFDMYLDDRRYTLSPSTIRFYRTIQKFRFQRLMSKQLGTIKASDWQAEINLEARKYSVKSLRNGYCAVKTVVKAAAGKALPDVSFGVLTPNPRAFLTAEEIPLFVETVAKTHYAVPLLLALSSMRISEIQALDWSDIPLNPQFIRVRGAVVFDENNIYQKKAQNKNASSSRNVPILIPELTMAIERDRQPSGSVMTCSQNNLRIACHKLCKKAGVTEVTPHGLRHSFASLAYHLQMPEKIAMEIGGWSDYTTMRKIYTHIAKSDIKRYQDAIGDFYSKSSKSRIKEGECDYGQEEKEQEARTTQKEDG